MKYTYVFIAMLLSSVLLTGCFTKVESPAKIETPEIAQESDAIIPEAPQENSWPSEDLEPNDDEPSGDEQTTQENELPEIWWALIDEEHVIWDLIVYNFGPMTSLPETFTLTWKAPRSWFFEGIFPVTLMSLDENIIAESFASGDWLSPVWESEELLPTDMIEFTSTTQYLIGEDFSGEAKIRFSPDSTGDESWEEWDFVEQQVLLTN